MIAENKVWIVNSHCDVEEVTLLFNCVSLCYGTPGTQGYVVYHESIDHVSIEDCIYLTESDAYKAALSELQTKINELTETYRSRCNAYRISLNLRD